jgi:Protein of unknown function (DUF3313)
MLDSKPILTASSPKIESNSRKPVRLCGGVLAALALIVSCPGCASYRPTQSGYLSDYAQLQKDPIHLNYGLGLQRAKSHNATAQETSQIDSYYIEPVQWLVDESSRAGGDPKRRDYLTSKLEQALRDQLGKLKPIVNEPGPGSARVRSAITNVKLSHPLLNIALLPTLITPIKVGPMFNGGGFVEAEVIGPDGGQVSAVSVASAGGPLDLFGYYTRSRHAKQAMQRAAWELRETLEH